MISEVMCIYYYCNIELVGMSFSSKNGGNLALPNCCPCRLSVLSFDFLVILSFCAGLSSLLLASGLQKMSVGRRSFSGQCGQTRYTACSNAYFPTSPCLLI